MKYYVVESDPQETLSAESTAAGAAVLPGSERPETSTGAVDDVPVLPESSAASELPSVVVVPTSDGQVIALLEEIVEVLRETEPEETTTEAAEEVPPPYAAPLKTMQLELAVLVFGVAACLGAVMMKYFWKGADGS